MPVPRAGETPSIPIVQIDTRNPAGFTSIKRVRPAKSSQEQPHMISQSNPPQLKDGKKSTIDILA